MKAKNRKVKVEFKTKNGDSIFVDATKTYEPERSKREDSYCIYCKNFINFGKEQTFCSCGKANEIRSDLYNKRCGALNIVETQ